MSETQSKREVYRYGASSAYPLHENADNDNNVSNAIAALSGPITSPLILPIAILFYSACQPTIAGLPYIFMLLIFVFLRSALFKNATDFTDDCKYNIIGLGKVPTISIFVTVYSFMYTLLPMLILNIYNTLVIVLMCCFMLTNIGLSFNCYIPIYLIGDILLAIICAVISVLIIISINKAFYTNKNFLFIQSSSTGEVCSVAAKQNFVCSVYKNGELVSQTPNIPGASKPTPAF